MMKFQYLMLVAILFLAAYADEDKEPDEDREPDGDGEPDGDRPVRPAIDKPCPVSNCSGECIKCINDCPDVCRRNSPSTGNCDLECKARKIDEYYRRDDAAVTLQEVETPCPFTNCTNARGACDWECIEGKYVRDKECPKECIQEGGICPSLCVWRMIKLAHGDTEIEVNSRPEPPCPDQCIQENDGTCDRSCIKQLKRVCPDSCLSELTGCDMQCRAEYLRDLAIDV